MSQIFALAIVFLVSFILGVLTHQWLFVQVTRKLADKYKRKHADERSELMKARWEGSWAAYESLADYLQGKDP